MRRFLTAFVVGPIFLVGCGSNPSDNSATSSLTQGLTLPPGTNAILAVKSTVGKSASLPTAKSIVPRAQLTRTITIDTAMIVFEDVKLHASADGVDDGEEEDDDGTEIEIGGPFLVDLVAETVLNLGTSNLDADADDDGIDDINDDDDDGDGKLDVDDDDDDGDGIPDVDDQTVGETRLFDALVLPPGTYRRIKFKMAALEAEDAPSPDHPMIGLSVLLIGSIDGVPIEFCSDVEEAFEFRSNAGIVVDDDALATFLLTIDPLGWLAGLNPSAGTLSEDGVLRICGDDNPDLADIVVRAIRDSARLGRDENGDGDDDDENGDLEDDDDDHSDHSSVDESDHDGDHNSVGDAHDDSGDNSIDSSVDPSGDDPVDDSIENGSGGDDGGNPDGANE